MTGRKNAHKKYRFLTWTPEHHSVSPGGTNIRISLDDIAEPDRVNVLRVEDDDAIYLARDLATLLGYKLVAI